MSELSQLVGHPAGVQRIADVLNSLPAATSHWNKVPESYYIVNPFLNKIFFT